MFVFNIRSHGDEEEDDNITFWHFGRHDCSEMKLEEIRTNSKYDTN